MRILFLSAWCPLPADNGAKLRISHLLRRLAQHHDIDLLSFAPEAPPEDTQRELQSFCASVELIRETPFAGHPVSRLKTALRPEPRSILANHSPTMAAAVRKRASAGYDLVVASELHMAPYALLVPVPRLLEEIELAILRDQMDHQQHAVAKMRYGLTWRKTTSYISGLLQHFIGATVVSEREMALLRPLVPPHIRLEVVPNGVDLSSAANIVAEPTPDTLIYPGALSYDANYDAVQYFIDAILPRVRATRPDVRFRVTGRATAEQIAALSNRNVEFTGYLNDVRPAIANAWAEVVPLRQGGGTRLKVLEALALGTPVITTRKGVEGLDLLPERDFLLADTPEEFAGQVVRLLRSPQLRAELVEQGRSAVQRYDWNHSAARLNDLVVACAIAGATQVAGSIMTERNTPVART